MTGFSYWFFIIIIRTSCHYFSLSYQKGEIKVAAPFLTIFLNYSWWSKRDGGLQEIFVTIFVAFLFIQIFELFVQSEEEEREREVKFQVKNARPANPKITWSSHLRVKLECERNSCFGKWEYEWIVPISINEFSEGHYNPSIWNVWRHISHTIPF